MISKHLNQFNKYFANYIDSLFESRDNDVFEFIPVDKSDAIFISRILWNIRNVLYLQRDPKNEELIIRVSDSVDELKVIGKIDELSDPEQEDLFQTCLKYHNAMKNWYSKENFTIDNLTHLEFMNLLPDYQNLAISRFENRIKSQKNELSEKFNKELGNRAISKNLVKNTVTGSSNDSEKFMQSRQLEIAHDKIKVLTKRNRALSFANLSDDDIFSIVDDTRKQNGTINYAKAARKLGIHADTLKRLLKKRNLITIAQRK